MYTLLLFFNLILYVIAVIIWIPTRLITILNSIIAYLQLKVFRHKFITPFVAVIIVFLATAWYKTQIYHTAKSSFDLQAIISCFKKADGSIDYVWLIIALIFTLMLSKLIQYITYLVIMTLQPLQLFFMTLSKRNAHKRFLKLRKSYKAVQNRGLYNTTSFKEHFNI